MNKRQLKLAPSIVCVRLSLFIYSMLLVLANQPTKRCFIALDNNLFDDWGSVLSPGSPLLLSLFSTEQKYYSSDSQATALSHYTQ